MASGRCEQRHPAATCPELVHLDKWWIWWSTKQAYMARGHESSPFWCHIATEQCCPEEKHPLHYTFWKEGAHFLSFRRKTYTAQYIREATHRLYKFTFLARLASRALVHAYLLTYFQGLRTPGPMDWELLAYHEEKKTTQAVKTTSDIHWLRKWSHFGDAPICRVGQNSICTPYITVCMVISLPKISYIHRIYL